MKWDFISKPNVCEGCPLADKAWLEMRATNQCHKVTAGYDVLYTLNNKGKQICKIRKRIRKSVG